MDAVHFNVAMAAVFVIGVAAGAVIAFAIDDHRRRRLVHTIVRTQRNFIELRFRIIAAAERGQLCRREINRIATEVEYGEAPGTADVVGRREDAMRHRLYRDIDAMD